MDKPEKITNKASKLFEIIELKIRSGQYIFTDHAKQRGKQRKILDEEVLNILEGKSGYTRSWNKAKDKYIAPSYSSTKTWRYCIEGKTPDEDKIRIIITFDEDLMPIITVILIED